MNVSKAGLDLIKSFEELKLTAYKPTPDDVWTLGYGHTKGVKEYDTCSIQQADDWVVEDSQEAADDVNHHVTAGINQNQFDALVSFVFNVGDGKAVSHPDGTFVDSTLLRKLNQGDFKGCAMEFLRWNKQAGKVLNGLTRRREAEKVLFETPYG